jgi:hypothetical protein
MLKLLLVTNFGLVFNLDPEKLARHILVAAILAAFIPNIAITLWILLAQKTCCNSITVAYLVGLERNKTNISYSAIYLLAWLLISMSLLCMVVLGIPIYLKHIHNSLAIRND